MAWIKQSQHELMNILAVSRKSIHSHWWKFTSLSFSLTIFLAMVGGGSIIVKYCGFWWCVHLCERWQTSLKGYCTLCQQAHKDKDHTYDFYGNISSGLRNGAWKTTERVVYLWHLLTLRLARCCHAEEDISCLSSQGWCVPLPPTLPATATTVPCCGDLTGLAAACLQRAVTRQGGHQGWLMGLQPAHQS